MPIKPYRSLFVVLAALALSACQRGPDTVSSVEYRDPMPITNDLVTAETDVGSMVFFDFDQSALSADATATLDKQAAWILRYHTPSITIEGHADERGTREYNLALGMRRANAVRNYLIAKGVNPEELRVISYGAERPLELGSTEEAWAKNRRVVSVPNLSQP
jgi:peptidoglycan-associated lipoprotein